MAEKITDTALIQQLEQPESAGSEKITDSKTLKQLGVEQDLSWTGAAGQAVTNIPSSAVDFGKAMVQPILHPIETAESFKNLGAGLLQKAGLISGHESEQYADAIGKFVADRYGSMEALKNTLANDPVGLAADISMLFTGGGGLAARAPGAIGKVGEAVSAVGRAVDPLAAAGKTASGVVKGGAAVTKHLTGDYLTHVGQRPLGEAFKAGAAGGEAAAQFQSHMRRPTEAAGEVVEDARKAVEAIGQEAGAAYRSGMVDISKDYHMLDFADINEAFRKHENVGKYKNVDLETPQVKTTRDQMRQIVDEWRQFAPAQYHTPEGFDALKRKLGYVMEETERGSPARLVAGHIYNAVKDTINKQAPGYAKVMEGYSQSKTIIREIERELTGKPDAAIGPALRKLQSVMRNNVHTNYGTREALAQLLVDNGAEHLMTKIAGQALSAWFPRGFGRAVGGGELVFGVGSALLGHPGVLAKVMMTLPFMSPRVMGEAAYYAGKGAEGSKAVTPYLPGAGGALFQAGRVPEIESRAEGGPVNAGQPYVVGERGPEVIVPQQDGEVIPGAGGSSAPSPFAGTGLEEFRSAQGARPLTDPLNVPAEGSMIDKLSQTWPARLVKGAVEGVKGPGDSFAGRLPLFDQDGHVSEEAIHRSTDVAGVLGGGVANAEKGAAGIFGGRLHPSDLETATAMEAKGFERKQIWDATGLFKGLDGKWRNEIPDQAAKFQGSSSKLGEVLDHPEMKKAYPESSNIEVRSLPEHSKNLGEFHPSGKGGTLKLKLKSQPSGEALSTTLHELQHWVQEQHGFAKGGNSEQFKNALPKDINDAAMSHVRRINEKLEKSKMGLWEHSTKWAAKVLHEYPDRIKGKSIAIDDPHYGWLSKELKILQKDPELSKEVYLAGQILDGLSELQRVPFQKYKALGGEIESRAVEQRAKLSEKERKDTPPYETLEKEAAQQRYKPILRYD